MSQSVPQEQKVQEVIDVTRGAVKCRIPQRLSAGRQKPSVTPKPKLLNNAELSKPKVEVVTAQQPRFAVRNAFRRTDEFVRPKSVNHAKDDVGTNRQAHPGWRSTRQEKERLLAAPRKPSAIPKRVANESMPSPGRFARPVITVPLTQKITVKSQHAGKIGLPDQETIKRHEDLELQQSDQSECTRMFAEINEEESITSKSDKMMQLKICWQEHMVQFDQMKNELQDRQRAIMELYANMNKTHSKMSAMGHKTSLPPAEELRIMNVAKMTPEQLLQLCAESGLAEEKSRDDSSKTPLSIDINKLYNMPSKIVATCEQTLTKRKEIIDWFENLRTQDKCIGAHKLLQKINEFTAENEMLKCTLDQVKGDFLKETNELVEFIRKNVKETIALQLRSEELTYALSELDSQNADLRKRLQNSEHLKSQSNKAKIEELVKELEKVKCSKIIMKDKLSRAEGQIKIGAERASQLEAALEHSRSQTRNLERTIQQLHDQNKKLQSDFDKELNSLTESIRENTVHLEEIADAREKLQAEKEDLEKRLGELAAFYNESLMHLKNDISLNVAKVIETEKKYEQEVEARTSLETKVESLCSQLLESELRQKDLIKQLQEKDSQLIKVKSVSRQLECMKRELDAANVEVEDYKNRLIKQGEGIKEIERNFIESIKLEENLKSDLANKSEYIVELEKKQLLLEQQLQESESKMGAYEEQLNSLKHHISQLQEEFGEFENLTELHEMINQQRAKLLEATRQNGELAEALQKKDLELENHMEHLSEQENLLQEREGVIKILSEKEEEQGNIIKLLRDNLEMRTQADNDLNQQIMEKNAEIESLITNVETRKQQISQLEKIILTLEDQTRKSSLQIRKYQDKINLLENKIIEYETYHLENQRNESPTDNLDNLIKILEDELGTSFEPHLNIKEHEFTISKKKYISDRKRDKLECHEGNTRPIYEYHTENESIPTKIVMGNYVKKTYISTNDEQYKGDNLDRKQAITNMDTQKWIPNPDGGINVYAIPPVTKDHFSTFRGIIPVSHPRENYTTRNVPFMTTNQMRDEKKSKMFKFAGHRL